MRFHPRHQKEKKIKTIQTKQLEEYPKKISYSLFKCKKLIVFFAPIFWLRTQQHQTFDRAD